MAGEMVIGFGVVAIEGGTVTFWLCVGLLCNGCNDEQWLLCAETWPGLL